MSHRASTIRKKKDSACVRIFALIDADGRCAHCGGTDGLTKHHLDPLRHGGVRDSARNVQILCRSCHDEVELQNRAAERNLDYARGRLC